MQLQGNITYNDEPFKNFFPERTAAYVDQVTSPPGTVCFCCCFVEHLNARYYSSVQSGHIEFGFP